MTQEVLSHRSEEFDFKVNRSNGWDCLFFILTQIKVRNFRSLSHSGWGAGAKRNPFDKRGNLFSSWAKPIWRIWVRQVLLVGSLSKSHARIESDGAWEGGQRSPKRTVSSSGWYSTCSSWSMAPELPRNPRCLAGELFFSSLPGFFWVRLFFIPWI